MKKHLVFGKKIAAQMSDTTSAFSYLSDVHDFSKIIGDSSYEYRTGVEFTPQELYMLVGMGTSSKSSHYRFGNKKFARSKYVVDDMPKTDGNFLRNTYTLLLPDLHLHLSNAV